MGFDDEDLEGDFDPAKYDKAMQVLTLYLNCQGFVVRNSALTSYCLNLRWELWHVRISLYRNDEASIVG